MLQRLRHRAQGQEGFTLIELLVVILIIGILAGVAIPVFLNQTGKANDANVKSDINSAATAEETYYTDNQSYIAASSSSNTAITQINPALTTAFNSPTPSAGTTPGDSLAITVTPSTAPYTGYAVTGYDKAGISFTYTRAANGAVSRSCSVPAAASSTGGCAGVTISQTTAQSGTW